MQFVGYCSYHEKTCNAYVAHFKFHWPSACARSFQLGWHQDSLGGCATSLLHSQQKRLLPFMRCVLDHCPAYKDAEGFFRISFPHLRKKPSDFQKKPSDLLKKPSDLRQSCAANACPEKRFEGRRHFLRRVPYYIGHGLTETRWHETAFLFTADI